MRLQNSEVAAIRTAVHRHFGPQARIFLFGSRTDDRQKGGDIDLFVETSMHGAEAIRAKLKAISDIQLCIGDCKIDMITACSKQDSDVSSIVRSAREQGIPL